MCDIILKPAAPFIFTFINLPATLANKGNRIGAVFYLLSYFFLILNLSTAYSADAKESDFLIKAEKALKSGNKKKADFYAARYLGVCLNGDEPECDSVQWDLFLKKRRLPPRAFIPVSWDQGYAEWFEKASRKTWSVPSEWIRENQRSFEITRQTFEDKFFVTVVAYPELEAWYSVEGGVASKLSVMPMGSYKDSPVIFFGRIVKGQFSFQFTQQPLDTQRRTLHSVWKPEFADLDLDGSPEVWLRYNIAWGNGFSQFLAVYKIKDDRELVLIKKFHAAPDGIVRRLKNGAVEAGFRTEQGNLRFETWEYKNNQFEKINEETRPDPFATQEWQNYVT